MWQFIVLQLQFDLLPTCNSWTKGARIDFGQGRAGITCAHLLLCLRAQCGHTRRSRICTFHVPHSFTLNCVPVSNDAVISSIATGVSNSDSGMDILPPAHGSISPYR